MSPEEMRVLLKDYQDASRFYSPSAVTIVDAVPLFLTELEELRVENMCLKNNLLRPPEPWSTFGSHTELDAPMVFWGQDWDADELPLWERPA